MSDTELLIEQVYKLNSARLLAVLTRIFGVHNLELAEDVLQEVFGKALVCWQRDGVPENPSAWVTLTAKNQAIDTIRAYKTKIKFADDLSTYLESEWSLGETIQEEFSDTKIKDDQLRMIFMCCHEDITPENRIPFILKTLCGFSIQAVARALLVPEETIKKRLLRTREKLKDKVFEFPSEDKLSEAMGSVHTVLYLLFNEGFHCSDNKKTLRIEFCKEAIGLVRLLLDEPRIVNQDTLGLLALMYFHISRVESRVDKKGFNIPIDLQDRSLWKKDQIVFGIQFLNMAQSIPTQRSGRFFVEALIASEHCVAKDFETTNWKLIINHYGQLIEITKSPVATLNQAIAIGYDGNIDEAIKQVVSVQDHKVLKKSHMPSAILSHLNAKRGNKILAYEFAEVSKKLGGTPHEHRLMMEQLERLLRKSTSA